MSNVSNYTFDNMSRIGLDPCCIDQTTIQNMSHANYMLQNYFASPSFLAFLLFLAFLAFFSFLPAGAGAASAGAAAGVAGFGV